MIPIYKIWLDILIYIYVLYQYHCFWSPSFPINSSPSNMATVVAQVIVQATGNALTKAVTAAEVRVAEDPHGKTSDPSLVGSGDPSFTTMRINKWFKQTNQIIHYEQKETTILQIGFGKQTRSLPSLRDLGSGLPQVIKRRFKGLHQITELKTVDGTEGWYVVMIA